jgi:hypothetical protein
MNRRDFLKGVFSASLLGAASLVAPGRASVAPARGRKLLIVQFGGGTRYSESIGDPGHRFIPHLWNELVPRGVLFSNMRVEGSVVHPNSTGSMMTGHWEWADLDWTKPLAHPTLFEIYRHASGVTELKTWLFAYASILAKAGESSSSLSGPNVVIPPTIPRSTQEAMDRLVQEAAATGRAEAGESAARECARLARETSRIDLASLRSEPARQFIRSQYEPWKSGAGSTSHDLFLAEAAMACMKAHAPDILAVCFGEIDCAHYGNWSRYVEAIRRTDVLAGRLWQTVQSLPEYRDQTLLLILPDHGRELEESGGLGYVHHSDFYTNTGADEGCRRVWMVAIGPGVPAGRTIERALPLTTVAATGLEFLGLKASRGSAESIWRNGL